MALTLRKASYRQKMTYKALVSGALIALAVLLPQMVHLTIGAPGGVKYLPMYLPVLLGGLLLGARWAVPVAVLSPLVSFAWTSALGSPMPPSARLPFMMTELVVFALMASLFSEKVVQNGLWAYPAVLLAQLGGRSVFYGLVCLFPSFAPLTGEEAAAQIASGFPGLLWQMLLVPPLILLLRRLLLRERP